MLGEIKKWSDLKVISFNLETDENILLDKAMMSI